MLVTNIVKANKKLVEFEVIETTPNVSYSLKKDG